MHNIHLAVTSADNHEKAIDTVGSDIAGWGGDDNWYDAFGAFCLKNNQLITANEPCGFVDYVQSRLNSVSAIESTINQWIEAVPYSDIAQQFKANASCLSTIDYYRLECYARHMYEFSLFKNKRYTLKGMQGFFEYQYTRPGITYLDDDWDNPYVVFIDMHS